MCKISETVGEVNQIRTERHAHALEYLQLPWKPSWRQTVGELRHLMSLFFLHLWLFLSLLYSVLLCVSLMLSVYHAVSQSFSFPLLCFAMIYFVFMDLDPCNNPYIRRLYCFAIHLLLLSAIPLLLFLSLQTAETMRFDCPDATSCKLSETLWRTRSHS